MRSSAFTVGSPTPTPANAANIKGKVLVCIGVDDPIIPPSERAAFEEEMNAGKVDWQMILHSGAGHSFTNKAMDGSRPGFVYHEPSDRRSWQAMINLFDEVFSDWSESKTTSNVVASSPFASGVNVRTRLSRTPNTASPSK